MQINLIITSLVELLTDKNIFKDLIKKQLVNVKPKAKLSAVQIIKELVT